MSERKSWDVQPKRTSASRPVPAPVRRTEAVRTARRSQPARPRPTGRLREKRRKARKTGLVILLTTLSILLALLLYALWLPQLRIQEVSADGPGKEQMIELAEHRLAGMYAFIVPRNSIFFFPREDIRSAILMRNPEAGAVSISRNTFTSISITATARATAFIWCGIQVETPYRDGTCFDTDAEGLVFKPADVSTSTMVVSVSSSTPASPGDLRIYASLDRDVSEGSPVGARVLGAEAIPNALRLAKAVRSLGVPVSALSLRGDEADLWVSRTTRITYVLGREEETAQLAVSVIPGLTLTDGSIQYLDLRFKGKAYVKRYGE